MDKDRVFKIIAKVKLAIQERKNKTLENTKRHPNPLVRKITSVALAFQHAEVKEKDNVITIKNDKGQYIILDKNKKEVRYKGPTNDLFYVMGNAEELGYKFKRD